jgi:RNA polymerase sigma factor (sigma-70 family)
MLDKLAKHHDLWIKMLINLGCDNTTAKDIVQNMYLRLHKLVKDEDRIMYNDDVNRYFVYTTLRNMYFSYLKKANSYSIYPLFETEDYSEDIDELNNILDENAYFRFLIDKIYDMVDSWEVYDKKLFDLYFIRGQSLRRISKGSKIGLSSIHNSVLNYKEKLRELLMEDLEDYYNEEYQMLNK